MSIRLEITCSQLVKDYYGKQSALTKCNFLLPLSAKNPSDFLSSTGKSINYTCGGTYANVGSALPKLEGAPGRGRDRRRPRALQTQPRLQTPSAFEGILITVHSPEARHMMELGRRGPAAVGAAATASKGSPPSLGHGVLPPHFQSDPWARTGRPYQDRHCPRTRSPA